VLCRLFAISSDVTRTSVQREMDALAASLLPVGRPGEFNEALIELGATLCAASAPRCADCPLQADCLARARGVAGTLPVRRRRRKVPHYDVTAALTMRDGRVLLAQRKADDMLGGLWEFPGGKREAGETLPECLRREMREELGVEVSVGEMLIVVKHAYTHFRITLHAYLCRLQEGDPSCIDCAAFRWAKTHELDELPMSVADRRIARALQQRLEEQAGLDSRRALAA
jgi:A/G-specific adenine glycosylase